MSNYSHIYSKALCHSDYQLFRFQEFGSTVLGILPIELIYEAI